MRSSLLHNEETLSLKSLEFDEAGTASRRRTIGPLDFSFKSYGLKWSGRFLEKSGRARLTLSTHLYTMPKEPERIEAIEALIKGARAAGFHFTIQDNDMILFDHHPLSIPVTPARLITALSTKVITCLPWIETFRDAASGTLTQEVS